MQEATSREINLAESDADTVDRAIRWMYGDGKHHTFPAQKKQKLRFPLQTLKQALRLLKMALSSTWRRTSDCGCRQIFSRCQSFSKRSPTD